MEMELKFKSIGTRWFVNVFAVMAGIILVAIIISCILINSLYIERVRGIASEYVQSFSALSIADSATFADSARTYAEQFEYKDKVEVQILDDNGRVIVTTTGFAPTESDMPDYAAALKSSRGIAFWQGKSTAGESVLAETIILSPESESSNGAVRWVVSLEETNKRIFWGCFAVTVVGIAFLSVFAASGFYFIRSIAIPIRDVSNTARKIAMGEFKTQIETGRNDEIGELCDAINYMASELDRAENLKNDFISSVSHELRTPLTAIRGWGETAKMSIGADEELVEKGLDVVLSESDRLSGLVEELLDFSRMQSGRLTVNTAKLNVTSLVFAAADMYIELAKQRNIELTYVHPKRECDIMGDSDRLKQVFINIIDNAVKYTESGGQVLVEQYVEEACVRILVKDTGVGIPAADIDRVKEKFFKSNKTVRGSGIGLAVADEIVKQHEGLLFVESTEGVGTTVTIVLPLAQEHEQKNEPEVIITPTPKDAEPTDEAGTTYDQDEQTQKSEDENTDGMS